MDKIIFGDNQFFGVNHMSEQTAIKQSQRYKNSEDIFKTLEYVNETNKSFPRLSTIPKITSPLIDFIFDSIS